MVEEPVQPVERHVLVDFLEHVERCTRDDVFLQRFRQGLLVHHRAA